MCKMSVRYEYSRKQATVRPFLTKSYYKGQVIPHASVGVLKIVILRELVAVL